MPITDIDRVKRALRIPSGITVHDARLTEIVGEEADELLQELNLDSWDAATVYHETLDILPGTGGQTLLLSRFPVTSVVALSASNVLLHEGTDFRVDKGGVIRMLNPGSAFDYGRATVEVQYTAGHISAGSTPAWLLRLGTLHAAKQYNTEPTAGIQDQKVDPISKSIADFDHDAVEREIQRVLARWRRAGD